MVLEESSGREYLQTFPDFERGNVAISETFGLARVLALLAEVGSPHLRLSVVHVAGTKGKGSTSACIASILSTSGYKTGLFTQPHLLRVNERFQVDGREIDDHELTRIMLETIRPATERLASRGVIGIQQFEAQVALAMLWFESEQVDIVVLEVGLGGRLDATNVVPHPLVSVLTPIGFDHMAVLGNTIEEIAGEKAAIVKRGVQAVAAEQPSAAAAVFIATCARLDAPLYMAGRDWSVTNVRLDESGTVFDFIPPYVRAHSAPASSSGALDSASPMLALKTPLLGAHQAMNAGCALVTCRLLAGTMPRITDAVLRDGLAAVRWPGRLQILSRRPTVVVDGAHTPESASALAAAIWTLFPNRNVLLVCGIQRDKDIDAIAARLAPLAGRVFATRARHQRAAAAAEIAAAFRAAGATRVDELDDAAQAVRAAIDAADPGDIVLVTGSLYLVGDVMATGAAPTALTTGAT